LGERASGAELARADNWVSGGRGLRRNEGMRERGWWSVVGWWVGGDDVGQAGIECKWDWLLCCSTVVLCGYLPNVSQLRIIAPETELWTTGLLGMRNPNECRTYSISINA